MVSRCCSRRSLKASRRAASRVEMRGFVERRRLGRAPLVAIVVCAELGMIELHERSVVSSGRRVRQHPAAAHTVRLIQAAVKARVNWAVGGELFESIDYVQLGILIATGTTAIVAVLGYRFAMRSLDPGIEVIFSLTDRPEWLRARLSVWNNADVTSRLQRLDLRAPKGGSIARDITERDASGQRIPVEPEQQSIKYSIEIDRSRTMRSRGFIRSSPELRQTDVQRLSFYVRPGQKGQPLADIGARKKLRIDVHITFMSRIFVRRTYPIKGRLGIILAEAEPK